MAFQWRRLQEGLTLLECIAAIAIVGTAIVAGVALVGMQHQADVTVRTNAKMIQFLSREMEYAQACDFDDLASTAYADVDEDPSFQTRWQVTNRNADTKVVAVEIQLTTPTGLVRTESLTTIRCREKG